MYEIDLNQPKQIVADVLANHQIDSVAFVGCGASMSELYPAKYFLANNTKTLNVQIFTANEFNYDTPAWLGPNTFVITCSLGGGTPETVEANETENEGARLRGAVVERHVAAVGLSRLRGQLRRQDREDGLRHRRGAGDPAAGRGL